jgi:hypothetical protein
MEASAEPIEYKGETEGIGMILNTACNINAAVPLHLCYMLC